MERRERLERPSPCHCIVEVAVSAYLYWKATRTHSSQERGIPRCYSHQGRRHSTLMQSMAIRLFTVSARHEKSEKCYLTTVEAALIRASLVFVGNIGASVLVCIAGIIVPASVAAQANITEQTAGGLSCVHTGNQIRWSSILRTWSKVALLLGEDDMSQD
jgi:hypothetical protein